MKKCMFSLAGIMFLSLCTIAATHQTPAFIGPSKAARNTRAVQLPKTQQVYIYNNKGQWDPAEKITFEYDAAGNLTKMESIDEKNRMLYEYDSNNMRTSSEEYSLEDDGTWYPILKKTYAYDPIVTNLIIDQRFLEWDGLENEFTALTYRHTVEVERDDKNRVTSWVRYTVNPETDKLDSTTVVKVTYDPQTGQADTWAMSERDRDDNYIMKEGLRYDDIEWLNTDNQIVGESDGFLRGNNRIKKAVAYKEGVRYSYNVTFDETGNTPDFRAEIKAEDGSRSTIHVLETTDTNGSFKEWFDEMYTIENEETQKEEQVISYRRLETTYDEHGNTTLEEEYLVGEDGKEFLNSGARQSHTYDNEGRLTETIQEDYNYNEKKWHYGFRIVYSDFYTPSAVHNPKADTVTAFVTGNQLTLKGCDMTGYTIYGTNGTSLQSGRLTAGETISIATLNDGLYIVAISTTTGTTEFVKFIK